MAKMQKISTRFYKDREVRAVWNEDRGTWFFSENTIDGQSIKKPTLCLKVTCSIPSL